MKKLLLLGSTGSIGQQTLEVIQSSPGKFQVLALSAHSQVAVAVEQAMKLGAKYLVITKPEAAEQAKALLKNSRVQLLSGAESLSQLLRDENYDIVVQAITGAAGLPFSIEVLKKGKTLALANKESLVIAGSLLHKISKETGAKIIPIDSEHSAIFQCLQNEKAQSVRKIFLTGSGGPFRERELASFDRITPEEALKHPNWSMGNRITIGSATMMNKAFEVIEAHFLFGLSTDQIQVLIHPQSIVHSMVEFIDGSILAQLGLPDMRVPIHYALNYPNRTETKFQGFDLTKFKQLNFSSPDPVRYPALELGYEAIRLGGVSGAVLNASDEVATQMFLEGTIRFPEIAKTVTQVLRKSPRLPEPSFEEILEADRWARSETLKLLPVSS